MKKINFKPTKFEFDDSKKIWTVSGNLNCKNATAICEINKYVNDVYGDKGVDSRVSDYDNAVTIKVGGRYLTRDNKIVKILAYDKSYDPPYPFKGSNGKWYDRIGTRCNAVDSRGYAEDLIEDLTICPCCNCKS